MQQAFSASVRSLRPTGPSGKRKHFTTPLPCLFTYSLPASPAILTGAQYSLVIVLQSAEFDAPLSSQALCGIKVA